MSRFLYCGLMALSAGFSVSHGQQATVDYPNAQPGAATQSVVVGENKATVYRLSNQVLEASWSFEKGQMVPLGIKNKEVTSTENTVEGEAPLMFSLSTDEASFNLPSSKFTVEGAPKMTSENGVNTLTANFVEPQSGVQVSWKAVLKPDKAYVQETFVVKATKPIDLKKIRLVDLKGKDFYVAGTVPGSPLVNKQGFYAGVELPMAQASIEGNQATIGFNCQLPMKAGSQNTFGAVLGVYPEGQLRRAFLHYVESERAQPYAPFLHYNGWYDDGLNPTEETLLKTIADYKKELVGRGVQMDSFVIDDGWDDPSTDLWLPHPKKFPNGFKKTAEAIRALPSNFGIWISPLGGYEYSGLDNRKEYAKKHDLIAKDSNVFDLSYPNYFNWYTKRCGELMKEDGVNYFKWDRAGNGVSPHFMALLDVSKELRKINPKVFLNATVGTWPSPFWLNHVDSTWRDGTADVFWEGKGDDREQWITFRDGACYNVIVKPGPLYPLNSMMHHGLVHGKEFQAKRVSMGEDGKANNNDLKNDSRIYFGSGANLQELYLTTSMMDKKAWDDVADSAKWARKFAPVLVDVHWVGGDPKKLDVYGYGAYNKGGATLALRNPDDQAKEIELDAKTVFEPTKDAPKVFSLKASYPDQRVKSLDLEQGKPVKLKLEPFEVLVFDMMPAKK